MNMPHKFMPAVGNEGKYQWAIYCEYCGHVAFHANHPSDTEAQKIAKEPCPRSPIQEKSDEPRL